MHVQVRQDFELDVFVHVNQCLFPSQCDATIVRLSGMDLFCVQLDAFRMHNILYFKCERTCICDVQVRCTSVHPNKSKPMQTYTGRHNIFIHTVNNSQTYVNAIPNIHENLSQLQSVTHLPRQHTPWISPRRCLSPTLPSSTP